MVSVPHLLHILTTQYSSSEVFYCFLQTREAKTVHDVQFCAMLEFICSISNDASSFCAC